MNDGRREGDCGNDHVHHCHSGDDDDDYTDLLID